MVHGYCGVYVEKAYVLGEAPDVLRTAVGQRSRWCKVGNCSSWEKEQPDSLPLCRGVLTHFTHSFT